MTNIELTIFILGGIIWAIIGFHFIGRHYYNYKLANDALYIKPLGLFKLIKIRYSDIEEVKIIPMSKAILYFFLIHIRFGYKLWGEGAIMIKRKTGFSRLIIITPEYPKVFIEEIQQKIIQCN